MLAGKLKELVAVAVFLVVAKSVVFGQMRVGTFIGSMKESRSIVYACRPFAFGVAHMRSCKGEFCVTGSLHGQSERVSLACFAS